MQKASSHRVHSKSQPPSPRKQSRINIQPSTAYCSFHVDASQNEVPLEFEVWVLELSIPLDSEWTRLLHIVGIWFQVLFHSPNRGSFHLSLAVLVHYRLPRSI